MRLTLPTRIPLGPTVGFAAAVFCVQQVQGTGVGFSLMFFAYIILTAFTFNVAQGFERIIGSYVLWYGLFTCIVGGVWKSVIREPADSNLQMPALVLSLYLASMFMLLLVVIVNRRMDLRSRSPLVEKRASLAADYSKIGFGCIIFGGLVICCNAFGLVPQSMLTGINQINLFVPLGIILGTIGIIRDSGGKKTINFANGIGIFLVFIQGFLIYSKQGMLTPIVSWIVAAAYMRLVLRPIHYIVLGACTIFAFTFVSTWAGGRNALPENLNTQIMVSLAIDQLEHWDQLKEQGRLAAEKDREAGNTGYFNESQGLFDRLTIIAPDDNLISFTVKNNRYYGAKPIFENIENLAPHFILPDKPVVTNGNSYAHEFGGLAADDHSTGISFSPVGECFHLLGWYGVLIVLPITWLCLFGMLDLTCGDMRYAPWGLLQAIFYIHAAPESGLGSLIYQIGYGSLAMVVAIVICTRFAPVVGTLFYGNQNTPARLDARGMAAGPRAVLPRLARRA